jgi:hypothetical protein
MSILVDTLIAQVREQTDENNTDDVKDNQIIRALNRAQRQATNILARRFEDMMWDSTTVTTTGGTNEYDIPSAAFASRIEKVEVETSTNVRYQLKRISNHKTTNYITTSQTQIPTQYSIKRNKFVIYPTPQDGLTLYVHYNKRAEDFVVQQGRINSIDTDNNYIIVDGIGSDVTTSTTGFGAYLNIIDYNTGDVKNTLQVSALDTTTNQITFKTTGLSASTVLGHTVATAIGTDAAVNDYVCLVSGTCVPEVDEAYTDYVLQHAIVAVRRRLGEPVVEDVAELKELKDELLVAWAGREQSHRVRRSSNTWMDSVGFHHRRTRT